MFNRADQLEDHVKRSDKLRMDLDYLKARCLKIYYESLHGEFNGIEESFIKQLLFDLQCIHEESKLSLEFLKKLGLKSR